MSASKTKVVLAPWRYGAQKGRCEVENNECIQYGLALKQPKDWKAVVKNLNARYQADFGCTLQREYHAEDDTRPYLKVSLYPHCMVKGRTDRLNAMKAAEQHFDAVVRDMMEVGDKRPLAEATTVDADDADTKIALPPRRTTVGNMFWFGLIRNILNWLNKNWKCVGNNVAVKVLLFRSLCRTAKLLTTEDGHVVGWSFSHADAAPTVASSTPGASCVAPPAAGVVVSDAQGDMPAAAASVGGASDGKDMHVPDCHMSYEACAPRAGGDVPAQQPIGAAAVDAVQLMEQLRSLDVDEKKGVAEATRANLVKVWKEKAKLDKGGKDYRGIISYDCMDGIPELMEASSGETEKYVNFLKNQAKADEDGPAAPPGNWSVPQTAQNSAPVASAWATSGGRANGTAASTPENGSLAAKIDEAERLRQQAMEAEAALDHTSYRHALDQGIVLVRKIVQREKTPRTEKLMNDYLKLGEGLTNLKTNHQAFAKAAQLEQEGEESLKSGQKQRALEQFTESKTQFNTVAESLKKHGEDKPKWKETCEKLNRLATVIEKLQKEIEDDKAAAAAAASPAPPEKKRPRPVSNSDMRESTTSPSSPKTHRRPSIRRKSRDRSPRRSRAQRRSTSPATRPKGAAPKPPPKPPAKPAEPTGPPPTAPAPAAAPAAPPPKPAAAAAPAAAPPPKAPNTVPASPPPKAAATPIRWRDSLRPKAEVRRPHLE
eukprot:s1280_g8.t1